MIKQIPEHPNYAVSDSGVVYSIHDSGLKELRKDISNGYARVELNGKKYYVASLVADLYLSPKPDNSFKLFYIDGNKNNCNVNNLIWLSKTDIQILSSYTIEYRTSILRGRA